MPDPHLVLAGASGGTGNLGVTALNHSALARIIEIVPDAEISSLDYRAGEVVEDIAIGSSTVRVRRVSHRSGTRFYRPDNLASVALAQRLGIDLGPAKTIRSAAAVLDVGGGDSFTDLYGRDRFGLIARVRELALAMGTPLALLPQTYGPFRSDAFRERARRIVVGAHTAWARDPDGFVALRELAGDDFDPDRHREGVDMAFGLDPRPPADPGLRERLEGWRTHETVGLNISGLVANDPGSAAQFGLTIDYQKVVERLVRELLDRSDGRVVLVPHVLAPPGAPESDRVACETLAERIGDPRIEVAPDLDVAEVKWLISGFGWFCGTRMHATIAALSTGVPTATIAYSLKARGVFETCEMAHNVADARSVDDETALDVVLSSFEARDRDRTTLERTAPATRTRCRAQFAEILRAVGVTHAPS
jgi:polysaccharide pyruvyl transferase WcaK-like protein